jgi:hypothetical protein
MWIICTLLPPKLLWFVCNNKQNNNQNRINTTINYYACIVFDGIGFPPLL